MSDLASWLLGAIVVVGFAVALVAIILIGIYACVSVITETQRIWRRR